MLPENKVFWKILVFLESFKVVSLFNYQGSLLLFLFSAATFISYHCFLSLSTTFLFIFQSFDWTFVFLAVSLRQLHYIIIRPSICQQLFLFFYKIPILFISLSFTELHSTLPYNLFLQTDFVIFAVFHSWYAKPEYTTPSKRNRYSCLRVSYYIFVKFCPVSHQRSWYIT